MAQANKPQPNNKTNPQTKALIDKLVQVRKRFDCSQDQMADMLGLKGRQSYAAVEAGDKGLTLDQVEVLKDQFPGEFDALVGVTLYDSQAIRKYRQMILQAIKFGADGVGKITKTKLAKLVYLADFTWYYENSKPMSGLPYIKLPHGPVAQAYFQVLDDLEEDGAITRESQGKAILIGLNESNQPPSDLLGSGEVKMIEKLSKYWGSKQTAEIVEFTHQQLPWQICYEEEVIPYRLITQEEPERIYGPSKKLPG